MPISITLGQSTVFLNGPWKFHVGDDAAWADPNLDDSAWESVDLTASAGAHDDDVGLTRYVKGWGARGHRGYSGYAWYRLRVAVTAPSGEALALTGPPAVDSAYQVFINGQLLGGEGRFSGRVPTVFSIQPRVFPITGSIADREQAVIAFRVWMGAWDLDDPNGGGIRIAPALGEASSIDLLYEAQWVQTIAGYIVEVVEAAAFILLAVMAWTLGVVEHAGRSFYWLCAALVFTAMVRANQAVFFWAQFETVQVAEIVSVVLLPPLCLAAWTMGWRDWLEVRDTEWMPTAVSVLTLAYIGAQLFTGSWFHGVWPHAALATFSFAITSVRILFMVLMGFIVYKAIRSRSAEWRGELAFALMLVSLISIGQFAREVSALGIPGIWFPFGVGVSRTQYAYAIFDVVFFGVLLRRFLVLAPLSGSEARQL